MPVLRNIETRYVSHNKPDAYGGLTLDVIPDAEQEVELAEAGLALKTYKDDGRVYYRFKIQPTNAKGENQIINVKDRFGEDFSGKVPNGTLMDIEYYAYDWEFGGKTGRKARVVVAKINEDIQPGSLEFDKRDD
jgi:hypothetical protein